MCFFPQHARPDVQLLLVGTKCDLEFQREISYDEGKQVSSTPVRNLVPWLTILQFAEKNGMQYIETSAKTGYNVNEVS